MAPEPEAEPEGLPVTVHAPAGNPLNATLPVAKLQVGGVMVPIIGALGVIGCAITTAPNDEGDVQLPSFTVKV